MTVGRLADAIADADAQLRQAVQHVQFGQRQPVHAAHFYRLANLRRVEPAATPPTTGDGADSCPRSPSSVPVASLSSVGNGPEPIRVVYALAIPSTKPTADGPMPDPAAAVAATVLLLVTNG